MIARLVSLATLVVLLCAGQALAQNKAEPAAKDDAKTEGRAAAKDDHAKAEGKAGTEDHGVKGEKGHAAEDPHDLSHANASKDLTKPEAIKADAAIFTFVIFLLLLAILVKFAWGPISRGLEAREKGIEEKIEQARLAAEQATAQLAQYEARLAAATAEAQQIVAKARQDADTAGQKIVAEAQSVASKERERAVADIGAAKNQALREIAEKSVDTAIGLARNIIRREVRPGDHEQLINEALKQFPSSGGSLN